MCSNEALEWEKIAGAETVAELSAVYPVIDELSVLIAKNAEDDSLSEPVHRSWVYLKSYPQYVRMYIDVWMSAFGEADVPTTRRRAIELMKFVMSLEDEIHRVFDEVLLYRRIEYFFNTRKLPGTVLYLDS